MKTILVTGGAGFIGSNFVKMFLNNYPDYRVINVDLLTYAGNLDNLQDIGENSNHIFVKCDIGSRKEIEKLFEKYDITMVVNFAAESHVDRSITNPELFLTTNIIGTQVLLDISKNKWSKDSSDKYCKEYMAGVKFVQISTDEVYGSLGKHGKFTELTHIMPNSPYSASKASADLIVRAYSETYGLPINITRCSNNYGPNQFPEKLIPLMINNCIQDKSLPIYGDGMQIRDWIHVDDHCKAIMKVLFAGKNGEVYNIGGNNEKANIQIVSEIINFLGKSDKLIRYVEDRPGHDRRYAIDNSKITTDLDWSPKIEFTDGLRSTIQWYLDNENWIKNIINGNYKNYYKQMYSNLSQK